MKTRQHRLPASAAAQAPVADPLGPATIDGTTITIDDYVNPPTRIPAIIRNLVEANRGYFANRIFDTPGFTVEGGAIIYEESFPEDFFLPEDQSLAPRAPGSEAPILGATRRGPSIAYPESWSGQIQVHDEARRRNKVLGVRRQFIQAGNTFANIMQRRAIETMEAFVTKAERIQKSELNWGEAHATGIINTDPAKMPGADLALVETLFIEDEAGVQPSLLILNPTDAYNMYVAYSTMPGGLAALLQEHNLELLRSPRVEAGSAYFVKGGGIGVMAFETPFSTEQERIAKRKTDAYIMEATPVFVAFDASAIMKLTEINK